MPKHLFILLCCAVLLSAQRVAAQQSLFVVSPEQQPVADAVVMYAPLNNPQAIKVLLTDSKGSVFMNSGTAVSVTISLLGYVTMRDTLQPAEKKTCILKPGSTNLKDIVVTGQLDPSPTDKSVHRVRIIDRQRIEQQGAVNLRDLLTNELNVRLTQDPSLGTQMSLQGLGGQNVKILIDGVPVIGRMDGNIDISQINLSNIERIEIIEGPLSVIYGTDALGGVINLISRKPTGRKLQAGASGFYESVGTYNADMNAAVKYKNAQLALSGGRNFFDGYAQHEDARKRVMEWKPKEQYFGDAQLAWRFKKQQQRLAVQFFREKITNRNAPTVTPYSVTGFDNFFYTTRFNTSLYSTFYLRNRATLNLINSWSTFSREKQTWLKNLVNGESVLTPNPEDHDTATFRLMLMRATYTTSTGSIFNSQLGYDINIETGTGKRLENKQQSIYDFAGFYLSEIKAHSRLTLKQGIRFIYNNRYGAPVIPSFNLKYDIARNTVLRASYAQGFRAPSLKELSLLFVDVNHNIRGNNDLQAETSKNYSLSLAYGLNKAKTNFSTELSLFYNAVNNMISLAVVDAATQLYSYVNIDEYRTQGLNLQTSYKYRNLQLAGGWGYTGRYNQLSKTMPAPDFTYSNEYRGNLTYGLQRIRTELSLFYKYNGALPGYAQDSQGRLLQTRVSAYEMMDASITKHLYKNSVQLTAGIKNLFDVRTINFSGTASAHSAGGGNMLVGMGRYFFTSIRIQLEKN